MSVLIPSELFWEILSRVPAEPLLRFRCVCTEWRQIIDDPTFIRSHVKCQAGRERVMIRTSMGRELYTFSLEALYNFERSIWAESFQSTLSRHGIPVLPAATCNGLILIEKKVWSLLNLRTRKTIELPEPFKSTLSRQHGIPEATCNGLILIEEKVLSLWNPYTRKSIEFPWSLRNPYTRKSIKLPLPRHYGNRPLSGLGYDQATDDYKVVRITRSNHLNNETYTFKTYIYSLKLGYWREIEDFPVCTCVIWPTSEEGLFVNGALHWMTNVRLRDGTDIADEMIIAFDLGTENYRLLPLPSNLFAPNKHLVDVHKDLNVLDGCLFFSCTYSNANTYSKFRCDGWMMKDYSSCGGIINSSWTKLFSFIPQSEIGKGLLRFIAYLKNKGQVLIQHSDDELFWLDIEKKSTKRVIIRGDLNSFTSQAFPATLVRLNDKASDGGDESILYKSNSRKEDQLV